MTRKLIVYIFLCFLLLSYCRCKNSSRQIISYSEHWVDSNSNLVKKTYSKNGNVVKIQFYSKDTTPSGAEIDYFHNGSIRSWKWWWDGGPNKKPICDVLYDSLGNFKKIYGSPFIQSGKNKNNNFEIAMICAPNMQSAVKINKYFKEKKIDSFFYEPVIYDSIKVVILNRTDEIVFEEYNKYIVEFYILGPGEKLITRADFAMDIQEEIFGIIKIPPFVRSRPR